MPLLRPTILAAAAALMVAPVLADTRPAPGCWSGLVRKTDGTPDFSVQLWLADTAGRLGGTLHFGSPRSCTLEANYKGDSGEDSYFSLTRPNGGSCSSMTDGTLSVRPDGSDIAFVVAGQPIQGVLKLNLQSTEMKSCLTR